MWLRPVSLAKNVRKYISSKLSFTPEINPKYFETGECVETGQTTIPDSHFPIPVLPFRNGSFSYKIPPAVHHIKGDYYKKRYNSQRKSVKCSQHFYIFNYLKCIAQHPVKYTYQRLISRTYNKITVQYTYDKNYCRKHL